jgi:excinuclease ABC subunit C
VHCPDLQAFSGFGECRLASDQHLPFLELALPDNARTTRRMIRGQCGPTPGVYGMIDDQGQLIYVGKSKALRNRLLSYFTGAPCDSKPHRIVARTRRLVWEDSPHEFAALLRELELIRRWRPRFNVRGQPRGLRSSYLCVGRGPAAYAYLAAHPTERCQWVFGPVRSRWSDAVRRLNDCFQLRDCPDRIPIRFADQRRLFVEHYTPLCLRHELGTCLGPCAAACSSADYEERVRAACAFLRGHDLSILDRLEAQMFAAAAAQQFERAAHLRDVWQKLAGLADCLARLREARQQFSFVYPLPDYDGAVRWYLIDRGHVQTAVPAPRGRRTARQCLRQLEKVYARKTTGDAELPHEDPDVLLLVTGWFRGHPEELDRTIAPADAMEMCRY